MGLFRFAFASLGCLITLSGCSSPFLPHNAVKYIPEFSHMETTENIYPSEDLAETEQGENAIGEETIDLHSSYFSPESIKERYTQHIEACEENGSEPVLDMKKETSAEKITAWKDADKQGILIASVQIMQTHGATQEEITELLIEKFGLTEEEAQLLLEQASEENSL